MTTRAVLRFPGRVSLAHTTFLRQFSSYDKPSVPSQETWAPPHETGRFPLYDMALQIIKEDSKERLIELSRLRENGNMSTQLAHIEELETLAEVNKPEILWAFRHGKVDMAKPVFRHLAKKEWMEYGRLDRLMQRIHTMNIVPDLVADIHPSVDLGISFGVGDIEPGTFVDPEQTVQPPQISVKAFHGEERYYTLVMVDPDVPDPTNQSFRQCVHWLVPNVIISSTSSSIKVPSSHEGYSYMPPHPQNGTPYHRYCLFLLENPKPHEALNIQSSLGRRRTAFSLRDFVHEHSFCPEAGGGAFFWRSLWNPAVTSIYRDILREPEPRYGRIPKEDRYEGIKRSRRYI